MIFIPLQIILTYFDLSQGPKVVVAIPSEIVENRIEVLQKLMDLAEEGYFEHHNKSGEEFISANQTFELKSSWARGNTERLMISLVADPDQKIQPVQKIFEKYISIFQQESDLYKGLYLSQSKKDPQILPMHAKWEELIQQCAEECQNALELQTSGRIVFYGLKGVGKTSIINRLNQNPFDPKIRPTIGMQVIKTIIETFQFQVFDLGGQDKLRKTWFDKSVFPNAIIYVFDATAMSDQQEIAKKELLRVIEHYFGKNSTEKVPLNIPFLILANKIDLIPTFTEKILEKLLKPKSLKINYHLGCRSALENIGFQDNFRWLVTELIS